MNDNSISNYDELLASFLDGNINMEEMQKVLSLIGKDKELRDLLQTISDVDKEIELEQCAVLPIDALAASNSRNLCSFESELFILRQLGFDIEHWSLLETAKANNWLKEGGVPLFYVGKLLELKGLDVNRRFDAKLEDIQKSLLSGKEIIAVVNQNILSQNIDRKGDAFHAVYVTKVESNGDIVILNLDTLLEERIEKEVFLQSWKQSENFMVTSSFNNEGYNPQPINVEEIILDSNLEELTEAIAENAHDIWARARMDEGWTYGPIRNDELKQHPDLVPYSRLPESEKEYDRIMAMNTLRLVRRLGFNISK